VNELQKVLDQIDALLKIENLSAEQNTELDTLTAKAEELRAKIEADSRKKTISEKLAGHRSFCSPQGRKTEPEQLDAGDGKKGHKNEQHGKNRLLTLAPKQNAFETLEDAYAVGMWARGAILGDREAMAWCNDHGMEYLDLSEGVGSTGGYLVPVELAQAIIVLREKYGTARADCRIVPMGTSVMNWPVRLTGVVAKWVAANTNPNSDNSQDPSFGQAQLVAYKLAALVKWPSEMAEDAVIELGNYIADEIAYGFAVAEDTALWLGDGTSTYGNNTGIFNAVAAGSIVTATSHTTPAALTLGDFENVLGALPTYADDDTAGWYVHKQVYAASMLRLMDAAGGNRIDTLATGQRVRQFMGYPVKFVQCLPTVSQATTGKKILSFGSLKAGVLLGDRRTITLKQSDQRYFDTDELAIRGTERINFNVHSIGTSTSAGANVVLQLG
jgi:HK97 family phage major capsid protein